MLYNLPREIIIKITHCDIEVFYLLRKCDRYLSMLDEVSMLDKNTMEVTYRDHTKWVVNRRGLKVIHRGSDLPAIIWGCGTQEWYRNGKRHRDNDLPAILYSDGTSEWMKNGETHRDNDLPAVVGGVLGWYKKGKLHRDNDLPAIIWEDGTSEWYQEGQRYRNNGFPTIMIPNREN